MSSIYGKNIRVAIFGQSHSRAIGVSIDGASGRLQNRFGRAGCLFAEAAPGQGPYATQRRESDKPEIPGLVGGVTCGAPSSPPSYKIKTPVREITTKSGHPRPSHADYTAGIKYGGFEDHSGGGHFSGRLTAALCIAGGLCLQI